MEKVYAVQDESGHWYVIPLETKDKFFNLLEKEEDEDEFIEKFSRYMTGGDLNLVQLYAEL